MNDSTNDNDDQDLPTIPPGAISNGPSTSGPADELTLPAHGPDPASSLGSSADEATLPPDSSSDGEDELGTLPGPQSNWRVGGKIRYFGDYELVSEIARGGMGVVYRARQTSLNRIVALKMILAGQLAGEQEVQRFHAEAEAAANLDHPGIVPIYEVGEVDGQHYFSMGYVDGSSLSELIAEHPLAPADAAQLTLKIAEAIQYAHQQGVIHRDLKPANVLIQKRGEHSGASVSSALSTTSGSQATLSQWSPRVTDFGLAKQIQGNDQLTASGQILGTPSYMPPEQAAGKIDEIDHRADVYSLGGILYALVTGRPPFQAASHLDTLMQVLEKEPVPPRQLAPKTPRDLETIALKALEKDPRRRYQTAGELAEDLQRFLSGEPILARSITPIERAWRWAKRKPLIAGLGALAAMLLVVVSIGGPLAAVQQSSLRSLAEDREDQANQAKLAAESAAEKEKAAKLVAERANDALTQEKEKSERTLYARTISLAYQAWQDDNVTRSEDLLNNTPPKYRDWEWEYVKKLCHSDKQTLRGHAGIPFRMQMSADGKTLVSIGRVHSVPSIDVAVYLWDLASGTVTQKYPYRGFAISPDATRVALETVSDGPVVIMDVATGKELLQIPAHNGGTAWANFNFDGTQLVTTGPDKSIRIWNAQTGERVLEITDEARRMVHDVNFSPDGKRLVWKTFDGMIQIYDATNGKKVDEIEDRNYRIDAIDVAISPDNQILAVASNGPIHLYDADSSEQIASLYGHRNSVLSVCFSPDGKRIASSGLDGTIRIWDVAQRREMFRFRGHKLGTVYGVWSVAYTPDGQWLLSGGADTTIKIWPADGGDGYIREAALADADDVAQVQAASVYPDPSQEKDWLVGNLSFVESAAFSPDGKRVATASKDDTVRLFDLASRKNTHTFTDHDQHVGAVAFSPDGKWLASGEGGVNESLTGKLMIWDLDQMKKRQVIQGHEGPIAKLIFSPDSKLIYSATGSQAVPHRGELIAWDFGQEKIAFRSDQIGGVTDMALSPDGKVLAVASYIHPVHLIDSATGELIKKLGNDQEIFYAVGFSPDGKQLATGKRSWEVGVWDVESGERLWEKIDHSSAVMGVAFSPDGRRVISSGVDRSTRLWDAESGDMLIELKGDSMEVFDVAVSPNGKTILTFGEAPYVTVRDLGSGELFLADESADGQWPVIFSDDFDRADLGDGWTVVNGDWEINDGAAKGTLKLMPSVPIPNFSATTLIPKAWFPSVVEIEFDAWAPSGIVIETKLADAANENALDSLFVAADQPYFNQTRQGGSVVVQAAGGFSETARSGPRNWFEPGRKYKLKTVRQHGRWEMFVDGKPLLQADVPDSMWVPSIQIQGSFGKAGDVFFIDNLVVRAPESTRDEVAATDLEFKLRNELKLTSLVVKSIEQREDVSDSVKKLALQYANLQKEDGAERKKAVKQLLLDPESELTSYQPFIDLLNEELKDSDDFEYRQLLAAAHYRSGDLSAALDFLKQAEAAHQSTELMSHPIHMALLALVSHAKEDQPRVRLAIDRLTELMRSEHWQKDANAVAWANKVEQEISLPEPEDKTLAEDIEAIKMLTFEPQQRARCHFDLADFFATYTDDAVHVEGREATPNQYDIEISHADYVKTQRIFSQGAPSIEELFVRGRADVDIDGDEAVQTSEYVWAIPFGSWRFENKVKLRRVGGSWKIYHERNGLTGLKTNGNVLVSKPADWETLDRLVAAGRQQDDRWELMLRLVDATRHQEAYDLAKELVQAENAAPELWADLSLQSFSICDPVTMESAAKKAVQIKSDLISAPYLRSIAVQDNLPDEALDLGHGIKVQTPTFYRDASVRDFAVPGQALRGWFPTRRSALIVFFAKDGNDVAIEKMADGLVDGLKTSLNVSVYRKGLTKIAGIDSADAIVEGFGTGRSMSKTLDSEAKGTIARWVVIPRGNDLIGCLLSAHREEFDQRNAEFQTWLQLLEIENE
ncbi:protein kinase domain-containing protein [Stieleria varia]|uniref:Serine/threonine-protein kinase PknB n=1 Tax=Stieleria varia TaxID=2528005 RepID=A0A5C6BAG3_9BACT|nr:protein kinase [Stieleria varia]TWU07494.1 Serine/threonine-protein kinase PknB [Stieleria varia]